jgi:hypothetical protein
MRRFAVVTTAGDNHKALYVMSAMLMMKKKELPDGIMKERTEESVEMILGKAQ